MNKIKKLVDDLIIELKKHGIVLQRYDAYSSNSVYLKLDYGVCNSIRISDHPGKKQLHYRYNVLSTLTKPSTYKTKPEGFVRNMYPFDAVDKLVQDIVRDRNKKIAEYGKSKYRKFMMNSLMENSDNSGFWSQCVEVI